MLGTFWDMFLDLWSRTEVRLKFRAAEGSVCTHTAPALCVCCSESHGEVAQEGWWISTLTFQERNRSSERLIILPKASQQV